MSSEQRASTVRHDGGAHRPYWSVGALAFLAARAVGGVEWCDAETYQRVLPASMGGGRLSVTLRPDGDGVGMRLDVDTTAHDARHHAVGYGAALALFDLGPEAGVAEASLSEDPWLAPLVRRRPGLRVPGAVDPHEVVVRAIVGQQVSVPAARTVLTRLAERYGAPVPAAASEPGDGALCRRFPTAAALARCGEEELPMPRARAASLIGACRALAEGAVSFHDADGAPWEPAELRARLLALRGIGPWTADYIVLRTTADRDVFLAGDLAVRRAAERLGMVSDPRGLAAFAERWRPWRSYAMLHLWSSLGD